MFLNTKIWLCAASIMFLGFVAVTVQAAVYSTVGDVKVIIDGDQFQCDRITCPKEAFSCVVIKQKDTTKPGYSIRSNTCYSSANKVLKQSQASEKITNPNNNENIKIYANRNGVVSSSSYTKQQQQQSQQSPQSPQQEHAEYSKVVRDIKVNYPQTKDISPKDVDQVNKDLNKEIQQLNDDLRDML